MAEYTIIAGSNTGYGDDIQVKTTNNRSVALHHWAFWQKKYPLDVAIVARAQDYQSLLRWVVMNPHKAEKCLSKLYNAKLNPAGIDVDEVISKASERYFDGKFNTSFDEFGGDQAYPFCVG